MRPNRLAVMTGTARAFIRNFFDLNPLGQLGLLVLRNGIAEKLTDLSGSPEMQISRLKQYGMDTGKQGALQLPNSLWFEIWWYSSCESTTSAFYRQPIHTKHTTKFQRYGRWLPSSCFDV